MLNGFKHLTPQKEAGSGEFPPNCYSAKVWVYGKFVS